MRRAVHRVHDDHPDLTELRRVVRSVSNRPLRSRLTRLVDQLVGEAGWDQVQEIVAARRVAELEAQVGVLQADRATLLTAVEHAEADAGRLRRERDDARRQLAELRDLARPELADELVELRVGLEAQRPTSPPLIALGQAARLTRAVRSTNGVTSP